MPRTRVEYADWNITVYREPCPHRCVYCWAWRVPINARRIMSGKYDPVAEAAMVAEKAKPNERVMISFTSDPYPLREAYMNRTRLVIYILRKYGCATVMILTKNPVLALKDADIMIPSVMGARCYVGTWLGTSITSADTRYPFSTTLEPGAPRTYMRLLALREYQRRGGNVWLSLEPIIPVEHRDYYPETILDTALNIIELDPDKIKLVVLGRLNYIPQIKKYLPFKPPSEEEARRYYKEHIPRAIDILKEHNIPYHIKKELDKTLNR